MADDSDETLPTIGNRPTLEQASRQNLRKSRRDACQKKMTEKVALLIEAEKNVKLIKKEIAELEADFQEMDVA